jgi:hypothetical protein
MRHNIKICGKNRAWGCETGKEQTSAGCCCGFAYGVENATGDMATPELVI